MSLSDKVLYADIVPDRLAYPRQAAFVRPFVWMRVHEDVDAAAEGEEGHVRGNAAAGESAKAATHSRHPPIDEGGPQEAEALAKKAWLIHRVIGAQAAQWERPPEAAGHRPPDGGEAKRLARGGFARGCHAGGAARACRAQPRRPRCVAISGRSLVLRRLRSYDQLREAQPPRPGIRLVEGRRGWPASWQVAPWGRRLGSATQTSLSCCGRVTPWGTAHCGRRGRRRVQPSYWNGGCQGPQGAEVWGAASWGSRQEVMALFSAAIEEDSTCSCSAQRRGRQLLADRAGPPSNGIL